MDVVQTLKKIGFDEKEVNIYLALLSLGPSPVRAIAGATGINRGTSYDILKQLLEKGLVGYYHKEKRQYFVAEDPMKLQQHLEGRLEELRATRENVRSIIPELQSRYNRGGQKPVSRYYEGHPGLKRILQDVLLTVDKEENKEYCVYSSANLREVLYQDFPGFTKERIKRGIGVKVIALGEGGSEQPLSKRKWLTRDAGAPSYSLIYGSKTAHIGMDGSGSPIGVVVEDINIARAQKMIFEKLWSTL